MKLLNSAVQLSALVLAIGASFACGSAQAVSQTRTTYSNPVNFCQGTLPNFEGNLRKRPLAVQNEGTGDAFVTCSFTGQSGGGITNVHVDFSSIDGVAHIVKCTGVAGFQGFSGNEYVIKNALVLASGVTQFVEWQGSDFAGSPATIPTLTFSMQCILPPGAGINNSSVTFSEDVGN